MPFIKSMLSLKSKLLRFWPWLILIPVVLVILFWPIFSSTGDSSYLSSTIFSKVIFKTNNLPESSPAITIKNPVENVLVFGGDIMLSRTVNAQMEKYKNYSWPFAKIYPLFYDADLAIANLESPFLITNDYRVPTDSFYFKANPKSIQALTSAGFDVLSLANNHILNQGQAGLRDTAKILDEAGIAYTGLVSKNLVIKESQGIKFAFLSYTYSDGLKLVADMLNAAQVESDIAASKKQADVVIVLMHAGTEYTGAPNKQQIDFAHEVIDAGADLVIGSHPHWPQTMENYQGKTIIYSLGNLVFDQMWSKETSRGLTAKVYFKDKKIDHIDYIPIDIKDYGQAEIMADSKIKNDLLKSLDIN